jgi:outer membrane lipoprotein-sorting protein
MAVTLSVLAVPVIGQARPRDIHSAPMKKTGPRAAQKQGRPEEGPQDMAARNLLRQMLQAEQRVALSGDQVTSITRNGQIVTSEQRILRNGTRALRLEYVQPANLAGEQIIDDGHTFWHYTPSTKKLEVSASRVDSLRVRVPQVMSQIKQGLLTVQWIGQDTVAGHNCAVVEVASQDASQAPRRRFWIDMTNGAQLRIDAFGANGQQLSSSYYTSVTYNPTFAKDAFRPPAIPGDVHATPAETGSTPLTLPQAQAAAGFPIQQPTYLPTGFHFQTASVSDFRRQKLVALRYVNGLSVLSVFETPLAPRAAERPGEIKYPRPGVLIMTQSGLRFLVVGNLSRNEMEKVIISVH